MKSFAVAGRPVGGGGTLVMGEVAQAHDGSLGLAHAFIDAIADAGADAVKFQTHIADAESSLEEPWRVRFSPQDATRFDYWKRMEFREDQWLGLKQHADRRGLVFLSSPFSVDAVDLLERIGMPAWKVASGEVANQLLLDRVMRTGRPVLLSTGMSPVAEIDRAVARLTAGGCPVAVMQCSSTYPTPAEKTGLNLLAEYRQRYDCPVGLSDHSGTIYPGLAAATLGADILEVHVALSRDMFGPDVVVSLTPAELRLLVDGVRFIARARSHPVDKDVVAGELGDVRGIFTKSLFTAEDLRAGTRLEPKHLVGKKPGTGIAAGEIDRVVGRRLACDVRRGVMLRPEHLDLDA